MADASASSAALRETIRRVRERGVGVPPVLATFLLRAHVLVGYDVMDENEEVSEELVERSVAALLATTSPSYATLSMQANVEETRVNSMREMARKITTRASRAASMALAIARADVEDPTDDDARVDDIHDSVFRYVCAAGGRDATECEEEEREVIKRALESAFPRASTRLFFFGGSEDVAVAARLKSLKELSAVVLGICVFNRAIPELAEVETGGLRSTMADIVPQYIAKTTTIEVALRAKLASAERLTRQYGVVIAHNAVTRTPDDAVMISLKDEHNNRAQYCRYLRAALDALVMGVASVEELARLQSRAVDELRSLLCGGGEYRGESLDTRAGVPISTAYPLLDSIGCAQLALANEDNALRAQMDVIAAIDKHSKPMFTKSITSDLLREASHLATRAREAQMRMAPPLLDANIGPPSMKTGPAEAAAKRAGCEIEIGGRVASEGLDLNGYDVFALVKRNGLLLPAGASSDGAVVHWMGKSFGFVNVEDARQFAAQPSAFLKRCEDVLKGSPELVHITHAAAGFGKIFASLDIPTIVNATRATSDPEYDRGDPDLMSVRGFHSCEFATQTARHAYESNIDPNYEWNEWALRRRVLHAANLRRKTTKNAQTSLSHFRRESATQVWLPKESQVQTAVAKATAMPQKKRFTRGIRGAPDVKMNVIEFDLDLGQPHER